VTARHAGTPGSPVIVFVHGVGSTAAIWDYQLRTLSDDVLAAADESRIERFHFVGCSLGGVVGFELWKRAPQRIRSLTFVGSFAAYPDAQAYADSVKAAARAAGTMENFARERAAKLGLSLGPRTDETIAQMACKSVDDYVASTQATWTGDYRSLLATIDIPTLVLVGERDAVAPLPLAREIADGIPGARLEVIAGAGHVTNADEPDGFDAALRRFLATVT